MERECVLIKVRRTRGSDQAQNVIVHGWPTGVAGLYVTLDYTAAINGLKRYSYTHIKSGAGFHCGNLRCKRVAIRYARKHFRDIDWTLDEKHVAVLPEAKKAYKQSISGLVFK